MVIAIVNMAPTAVMAVPAAGNDSANDDSAKDCSGNFPVTAVTAAADLNYVTLSGDERYWFEGHGLNRRQIRGEQ